MRTAFAAVDADAAVVVTLTETHVVAGRAQNSASANSAIQPRLIHAGRSSTVAEATGLAAIRRDVFGFAAADGTATGQAIPASKIGQSTGTATSTVDLCRAHEIIPGNVLGTVFATGAEANAKAIRYPTLLAQAGVEYTRAESRIQLSGQTIWLHDGFVPPGRAIGACSASVPNDRMVVIATIGAFVFGEANAAALANIKFRAAAVGTSTATRTAAQGAYLRAGQASATAESIATTTALRTTRATASGIADAAHFQLRALVNYRGHVNVLAEANLVQPIVSLRTAAGRATALAEATLANFAGYGTQHRGVVGGLCEASAAPIGARQTFAARAVGQAESAIVGPTRFGTQQRGDSEERGFSVGFGSGNYIFASLASSSANASSQPANYLTNWAGAGYGAAAANGSAIYATQQYALASGDAIAFYGFIRYGSQAKSQAAANSGALGSSLANLVHMADAVAACTSTASALPFANSDKSAPDERYMVVPTDDRVMFVGFEERLMVAA